MGKTVILITGTPGVGKTTVAKQLGEELNALYINLTELAQTNNLVSGEDKERKTAIIDEKKMRQKISEILSTTDKSTIVIDGHYAGAVVPKRYVTKAFVLRRNPVELHTLMQKSGFSGAKLWENLASEILDGCLFEAVREQGEHKVCELDITGKTPTIVSSEIRTILSEHRECPLGQVDWLGMLENKGILDKYLRF
jgi:adenylate kinase